jgi:hypothetical protein
MLSLKALRVTERAARGDFGGHVDVSIGRPAAGNAHERVKDAEISIFSSLQRC